MRPSGARRSDWKSSAVLVWRSVRFSVIPYRPCREDDSDRAIALAWRLRGKGLTVPWLDVLIAAIAIHDGVRLYAIDAHFQDITKHSGLLLYRPGYGGSFSDVDDG